MIIYIKTGKLTRKESDLIFLEIMKEEKGQLVQKKIYL